VEVAVEERDTPEPATTVVEEVAEIARKGNFDVIIGLGGGSILDVAKMASALLTNPGKTKDYFGKEKVSNRGKPTIIVRPRQDRGGGDQARHLSRPRVEREEGGGFHQSLAGCGHC